MCIRDRANILIEPIPLLVVAGSVASEATVVVSSIAEKNADRLSGALENSFRVHITAADIHEATDDAEHLAKVVGPLPGDGERRDRARTCLLYTSRCV